MTAEQALLPCAHDNGEAKHFSRRNGVNLLLSNDIDYWVSCEDCGAQTCMHETQELATNAWNTRVPPPPVDVADDVADVSEEESAGDFVTRLGIDGSLWAKEMHKRFPQVPEDDLLGWCCNMIMAGVDHGNGPINGDHAQYLIDKAALKQRLGGKSEDQ